MPEQNNDQWLPTDPEPVEETAENAEPKNNQEESWESSLIEQIRSTTELFVNAADQPCIGVPLLRCESSPTRILQICHERVSEEIALMAYINFGVQAYGPKISAIIRILKALAWREHRTNLTRDQAIDEVPLVEAVYLLLNESEVHGSLNESSSTVLNQLEMIALKHRLNTDVPSWPSSAAQLSRRLRELKLVLSAVGITCTRGRRSGGARFLKLTLANSGDDAVTASQAASPSRTSSSDISAACDGGDDGDDAISKRFRAIQAKEII